MQNFKYIQNFGFFLVFIFLLCSLNINAQGFLGDKSVHKGELENGMKYYIKQNELPEDEVELRLIVNVGSLVENENEQGFAHFVEHMCFNGTRNFPGNQIIDYLESEGLRFGRQFNAYTSFAETVYMLTIPTQKEELLRNGFQILTDWAAYVNFSEEEIEKERGVIIQEWRTGQGSEERLRRQYYPVLFGDARYTDRLPIGKKPILENFPPQRLRDFYNKWYRPELMSVVVVGDLSIEESEQLIEEYFGSIPPGEEGEMPKEYPVKNKTEVEGKVCTDTEATKEMIRMYFYDDKREMEDEDDFEEELKKELIKEMVNYRFKKIAQSSDSPFLYAHASKGRLVRTKDAFTYSSVARTDKLLEGYKRLLKENRRLMLHGFIESEIERQKRVLLNNYENKAIESDKIKSGDIAKELQAHVLEDEAVISVKKKYEMAKDYLPKIQIEEVNDLISTWLNEKPVIIASLPDDAMTDKLTDEFLENLYKESLTTNPDPYEDDAAGKTLNPRNIDNGKIIEESHHKETGVTVWKLSNGAEVVLKPTDYSNNQILFMGLSKGGRAMYEDEDYISAMLSTKMALMSGVGDLTYHDVKDVLSGKTVRLSPWIGRYSEGTKGSSSKNDVESLLELNYLYFTSPRFDSSAIEGYLSRYKTQVSSFRNSPDFNFSDTLIKVLYGNNPRYFFLPEIERLDRELDKEKAKKIYRERFANANDFTFIFVGNINEKNLKPLVERYIASLPGKGMPDEVPVRERFNFKGEKNIEVFAGEEEKSQVNVTYAGNFEEAPKDENALKVLTEILKVNLRKTLREEKSGVYGITVESSIYDYPAGGFRMNIAFECAPSMVDELLYEVEKEIKKQKKKGPDKNDIEKVKKILVKEYDRDSEDNRFWQKQLQDQYLASNNPLDKLEGYVEEINAVNENEIQEAAINYLLEDNKVIAKMFPEKKDE